MEESRSDETSLPEADMATRTPNLPINPPTKASLIAIPLELRRQIYAYMFEMPHLIEIEFGHQLSFAARPRIRTILSQLNRTCWQIHDETKAWLESKISIPQFQDLDAWEAHSRIPGWARYGFRREDGSIFSMLFSKGYLLHISENDSSSDESADDEVTLRRLINQTVPYLEAWNEELQREKVELSKAQREFAAEGQFLVELPVLEYMTRNSTQDLQNLRKRRDELESKGIQLAQRKARLESGEREWREFALDIIRDYRRVD